MNNYTTAEINDFSQKENAEKLLNTKLDEIEEGYQRYLMGEDNEWENDYKEDTSVDLSELS